jgi:DNA repair protein RecO (recombination protein O)
VILRTRPLGESDLVVVLLTPEQGKVDAAARNARRSTRRFSGGLSPGMRGRAMLSRSRRATSSLMRLGSFEQTALHTEVGRDLTRFAYVAYVCELTDAFVFGRQTDPRLFAALCTTLEAILDPAASPPSAVILRRFELLLLRELGLLPAFRRCAVCGRALVEGEGEGGEELAFDVLQGGALCSRHGDRGAQIPATIIVAAAALCALEPPRALMKRIADEPASFRRALRDITFGALRQHLRRPLRSLVLFQQLALGTSKGGA